MGLGNVLVKTGDNPYEDDTWVEKMGIFHVPPLDVQSNEETWVSKMGIHHHAFIRTGDESYWLVVEADCRMVLRCSTCLALQCVGCGNQVLVDLDNETATCEHCLQRDIFQVLSEAHHAGPGRQPLGLSQ